LKWDARARRDPAKFCDVAYAEFTAEQVNARFMAATER
jgi:hypothetical protein